jgi:hypothetical protein
VTKCLDSPIKYDGISEFNGFCGAKLERYNLKLFLSKWQKRNRKAIHDNVYFYFETLTRWERL